MKTKIVLFLLLLSFSFNTLFAIDYIKLIGNYNRKLTENTSKIKGTNKEIQKTRKTESIIYKRINDLDNSIVKIRRELRQIAKRQETKQRQINIIQAAITNLRKKIGLNTKTLNEITKALEKQQLLFKMRIFTRYKIGRWWSLSFVVMSKDFRELSKRIELLNILSEQDHRLLLKIRADRQKKAALIEILRKDKEKYDNLLKKRKMEYNNIVKLLYLKRRKFDRLKLVRYQKQRNLNRLRSNRVEFERTLTRLKNASLGLRKMIIKFQKESVRHGNFARMKGRLPWPVAGKVVTAFGRQVIDKQGGSVIYSDGIDIKAPLDAKVRAINNGTVLLSRIQGIYGLMIIIRHGYYYTVYAHLDDSFVKVGQKVNAPDVIGTVGTTGYTETPILHFEIRLNQKALNPMRWLRRRR